MDNSEFESPVWRRSERGHLFLDDIQEFTPTDFKRQCLYRVIDYFYRSNRSISVTSNLTLSALVDRLGPHVVRRLDDMCRVVSL